MNRLVVHDSLHRLEEMTKQYKEIVTAGGSTPELTQPNDVVATAYPTLLGRMCRWGCWNWLKFQ